MNREELNSNVEQYLKYRKSMAETFMQLAEDKGLTPETSYLVLRELVYLYEEQMPEIKKTGDNFVEHFLTGDEICENCGLRHKHNHTEIASMGVIKLDDKKPIIDQLREQMKGIPENIVKTIADKIEKERKKPNGKKK